LTYRWVNRRGKAGDTVKHTSTGKIGKIVATDPHGYGRVKFLDGSEDYLQLKRLRIRENV
jgi:membrane protein implicated in regulation of membrane protease activity